MSLKNRAPRTKAGDAPLGANGRRLLAELERALREATGLAQELRNELGEVGPALRAIEPEETAPTGEGASSRRDNLAAFERVWERISHEQLEQNQAPQEQPRRGLDLLPQVYLATVEDREGSVDLVQLHRALLALVKMEDLSLVSYANGVPVVSLRVEGQLDHERLGNVVGGALERDCEVIDQENGKLFLRLTPGREGGNGA